MRYLTLNKEISNHFKIYILLGIYSLIIIIISSKHELWFDEIQAWQISKYNTISGLFLNALKYEGHPPLWYLLLYIPAHLNLTILFIKFISCTIGILNVYLLVRFTKLNWILKILIPFTYFIGYQYVVVARNYSLLFLGLLLCSIFYDKRFLYPIPFILSLVIITGSSSPGMIIAIVLFIMFVFSLLRRKLLTKYHKVTIVLFLVSFFLILLTLFPIASDGTFLNEIGKITQMKFDRTINFLVEGMTGNTLTTAIFLMLICFVLILSRSGFFELFFIFLALIMFFSIVYMNIWHSGIFFLTTIFCFLIFKARSFYIKMFSNILMILICIHQVFWTVMIYKHEVAFNYSGAEMAANYIKRNKIDLHKVYAIGNFNVFAVYGFFDRNIFTNVNSDKPLFEWSSKFRWNQDLEDISLNSYILATNKFENLSMESLRFKYKFIEFPGQILWKEKFHETEIFYLFYYN